jgi:hypothetical protein
MLDRDPHPVHLLEHGPQRLDRTLQHRRERDVEREAGLLQQCRGLLGFAHSLLGQPDVGPAGEAILLVPLRLAVTQQHYLVHSNAPMVEMVGAKLQ